MVQLDLLEGESAERSPVFRRLPILLGRAEDSDLVIDGDGIWDRHLEIDLQHPEGFKLKSFPETLTLVNGEPCQQTLLKNGDLIEIGEVKVRFWLSDLEQKGLDLRETLIWSSLVLLVLAQLATIYALLGLTGA